VASWVTDGIHSHLPLLYRPFWMNVGLCWALLICSISFRLKLYSSTLKGLVNVQFWSMSSFQDQIVSVVYRLWNGTCTCSSYLNWKTLEALHYPIGWFQVNGPIQWARGSVALKRSTTAHHVGNVPRKRRSVRFRAGSNRIDLACARNACRRCNMLHFENINLSRTCKTVAQHLFIPVHDPLKSQHSAMLFFKKTFYSAKVWTAA